MAEHLLDAKGLNCPLLAIPWSPQTFRRKREVIQPSTELTNGARPIRAEARTKLLSAAAAAQSEPVKRKLADNTAAAVKRGVFGIPTFFGRPPSGQAPRHSSGRAPVVAEAPSPRRALDRPARGRRSDARRRGAPPPGERIGLCAGRRRAPSGQSRPGRFGADRSADRSLPLPASFLTIAATG